MIRHKVKLHADRSGDPGLYMIEETKPSPPHDPDGPSSQHYWRGHRAEVSARGVAFVEYDHDAVFQYRLWPWSAIREYVRTQL